MTDDQVLRLECLRICSNTAEAKAAYFWINGEGRAKDALSPNANQYLNASVAYNTRTGEPDPFPLRKGSGHQS